MFKSMKLGTKIGVGFGLLLIIAMTLGGLAVWNMWGVQTESNKLAQEYAPEVTIVSELERDSADTMYEIRGYTFTEEKAYVDEGRKNLGKVKDDLKKADELVAKSPNLVKFKDALPAIQTKVAEYENMVNETEAKVAKLTEIRQVLDVNAKKFMENCDAFLTNQNEMLKEEIRSSSNTSTAGTASTQPAQTADATSLQKKLEERVAKLNVMNDIIDLGNTTRIANWRSQAERDPKIMQEGVKNVDAIIKKLDEIRQITRLAEDLKRIDAIKEAGNNYGNAMNNLLTVWISTQDLAKRRGVVGEDVLKQAKTVAQAGIGQTNEIATTSATNLGSASTIMLIGLATAFVIGITLAFFITRSITGPINRIITGLNEGADQVNDAANQVSSASQQLAAGASEQASSLEETSSALEEMAAMTRTNAASAKEANGLAAQARTTAQEGDQTMVKLNGAMTGINESSQKISKIIKVIEEIAFQTNLLALNAAVEAARAGEHGKGFAVVADEVRNLAQRCAQAAKETTGLIEDAVNRSREGTQVATEVGKSLGAIVGDVSKVSGLIDAISKASDEQAAGVEQVNVAVSQMDKVTQENAAGAEESASASEEMAAQAQAVKGMVNELMTMVSGHNNNITTSTTKTRKQEHKVEVAHIAKKEHKLQHAGAGASKSGKGSDFHTNDDADMKEF